MQALGRGERNRARRGAVAPEAVPQISGNNSLVLNHTPEGRLFWRRPPNYAPAPNAILEDAVYNVDERLQFSFDDHPHGRNAYIADVFRESDDVFDEDGMHFKRSLHALCCSVMTRLRRLNSGNAAIPVFRNSAHLFTRANIRFQYEVNGEDEQFHFGNYSTTSSNRAKDQRILYSDLFPMFNNQLENRICPTFWDEYIAEVSARNTLGSGGADGESFVTRGYQITAVINENVNEPSLSMFRRAFNREASPQNNIMIQLAGVRPINRFPIFNSSEVLFRIPRQRTPAPPIVVPTTNVEFAPLTAAAFRANVFQNLRNQFPGGGCRDNVNALLNQSRSNNGNVIETPRQVKGNSPGFLLDLNNMVVWCPNVKNNNCFFACVKYCVLSESNSNRRYVPFFVSERVDAWRNMLKISAKKMVDFQTIYRFNQTFMKRNINIYDEHHNLITQFHFEGDVSDMLERHRPNYLPLINLVLFNEHFFVIVRHTLTLFMCEHCGQRDIVNMSKHICNPNKVSYFHKRVHNNIVYEDKRPSQNEGLTVKQCLWEHIMFYDFETFFNGKKHMVYAVGASHVKPDGAREYFSFTGDTALETFMQYLQELSDEGIKLTLVSYNGSNFDHYFLLENQIQTNGKIEEFVMNKGRLLQIHFMGHRLLDLWNFLGPASLDANCKSYQIPISKHVFPHLYPRDWSHIDYVGPLLGEEFYPAQMREKYREWSATLPDNYVFNFMDECEHYLKLDVRCLEELGIRFMTEMWNNFQVYLPNYMTLSQTAFALWRASLNPNWQIPLPVDPVLYKLTNEATYGGRCHFVKRHFQSSTYLEGITLYDDITDYLVDLDVVSLYPASMMDIEYPCGPVSYLSSSADVKVVQDWLDQTGDIPIGIYEVEVICPEHFVVTPLPRKNDKGHTVWNNLSSERQVYTNVDIRTGMRYGYSFQIISAYVWKQKQPLFGQYIHDMFQNKAQQDVFKQTKDPQYNPAAREVFKKLMNALYGKMMQKRQFEDHDFVNNDLAEDDKEQNKKWSRFLDQHEGVQYRELSESTMLISGDRKDFDKTVTKPHYLGAFILAHSRVIMNNMYDIIDPTRLMHPTNYSWKDSMSNSFFYTDTDSLIVHSSQMAQCSHKMGKDLGMLADELDGGKIVEGYFLSPKLYCVKYVTPDGVAHEKVRAKGIPNAMLRFQDYKNMFHDNDPTRYDFVQMRRIQQDVNAPQLSLGMEPFTIISVLDAHRTLNATGSYGVGGEFGGRRVLDNVVDSVPIGFKPVHGDDISNLDYNEFGRSDEVVTPVEDDDQIVFIPNLPMAPITQSGVIVNNSFTPTFAILPAEQEEFHSSFVHQQEEMPVDESMFWEEMDRSYVFDDNGMLIPM